MLTVIPTGETLGATIDGLDLSQSLSRLEFQRVLTALGQRLESEGLKAFSERFGDIQGGG